MGTSIPSTRLRKSTTNIRDGDLFNCSPEWASLCYCGVCSTLCDHPPGFSRVRCGGCGGMGHKAKTAGSTQSVLIIIMTNVCCALDGRVVVVHVTCRDAQVVWSRVESSAYVCVWLSSEPVDYIPLLWSWLQLERTGNRIRCKKCHFKVHSSSSSSSSHGSYHWYNWSFRGCDWLVNICRRQEHDFSTR